MNPHTVKILGVEVRHFRPPIRPNHGAVQSIGTALPLKNIEATTGMEELRELLEQVCYDAEISVASVRGPRQHKRLMNVRRAFTIKARRAGFTVTMIAHLLNRHHSSIVLLGKD